MEWISVKERLPESKQHVLVYDGDIHITKFIQTTDKRYKVRHGYFDTSDGDYLEIVTHWMPLPALPKE